MINAIASQALRGQAVKITLNPLDNPGDISQMQSLVIGQVIYSPDGLNPYGTVSSIDYYGNSFKIIPLFDEYIEDFAFATSPGILNVNAEIYVD